MKLFKSILLSGAACLAVLSCSKDGFESKYDSEKAGYMEGDADYVDGMAEPGGMDDGEGEGNGNHQSGMLTAAEWNDLRNWSFWGGLLDSQDYHSKPSYWGFFTDNRIAVKVLGKDAVPVVNQPVSLSYDGQTVWDAVTDNKGETSLWFSLYSQTDQIDTAKLAINVDGLSFDGVVITGLKDSLVRYNEVSIDTAPVLSKTADIAFIVDATGSMMDEIDFLKQDLLDILTKVKKEQNVTLRTGTVFYRDEDGDEYVTKYSQFSEDASATSQYISKQSANGGGDYPEAVHKALEAAIQQLSWSDKSDNRLAFLILDAPAHHEAPVISSLQSQIQLFAKHGIRIIPVAASGVDKNTEFMCRFFSIATGGTYVFLTNDSGIGGDHIEASVGQYQVEPLNSLLVRLIKENIE